MHSNRFFVGIAVLLTGLAFTLLAGTHATAQTETVLYNFSSTGSAGISPNLTLAFDSSGNLYGTTTTAVFALIKQPNGGWKEKTLHVFSSRVDGRDPAGGVVLDAGGNIYGFTIEGGFGNAGTAYELVRSSTGEYTEKILHDSDVRRTALHFSEPQSSMLLAISTALLRSAAPATPASCSNSPPLPPAPGLSRFCTISTWTETAPILWWA